MDLPAEEIYIVYHDLTVQIRPCKCKSVASTAYYEAIEGTIRHPLMKLMPTIELKERQTWIRNSSLQLSKFSKVFWTLTS